MGELAIFDATVPNFQFKGYRYVEYLRDPTGIAPLTVKVPPSNEFYDMDRSYFEMRIRLRCGTAGLQGIVDGVSDANNCRNTLLPNQPPHSMFRRLDVKLAGTPITDTQDTYHLKAYFQTLLNYNRQEGKSLLKPTGWFNQPSVISPLTETRLADNDRPTNVGMRHGDAANEIRKATEPYHDNAYVTLIFRPYEAPFWSEKVLIPQVEQIYQFYFNEPELFFFGTRMTGKVLPQFRDEDIEMKLVLCQLTLNISVHLNLVKELQHKRARYHVVHPILRTFTWPGNTTRWRQDDVFRELVPDRMFMVVMPSTQFNGQLNQYMFDFKKMGIKRLRQKINSNEYPYRELELNPRDALLDIRGYHRLLDTFGCYAQSKECMIEPDDWSNNCCIFAFNNVPNGHADDPSAKNPPQGGQVTIEVEFDAAPNQNLTFVFYGEFEREWFIYPGPAVSFPDVNL